MTFLPTIKQFLSKAVIPMGHTMYVYGGGWNEEDTAAGAETRTVGESAEWKLFFEKSGSDYNFRDYMYCTHLGLDCTGYIGWALYNLFNTENGKEGYVFPSAQLGEKLHRLGLGVVTPAEYASDYRCGDIFYSQTARHAFICIGSCGDGSVLLMHSSPPGVMVSGTTDEGGAFGSLAQRCANDFMKTHFPLWYKKFPCSDRGSSYLKEYDRFRFYRVVVPDPDDLSHMPPEKILQLVSKI